MKSCLALCSGGVDSVTLAAWLGHEQWRVRLLYINYGQVMAETEMDAVKRCASLMGFAAPVTVDVGEIGMWGDGATVARGAVGAEGEQFPHRNLFLIGTAAIVAASLGVQAVALGVIGSETAYYADCRKEFLQTCGATLQTLSPPLELLTPFDVKSKIDVVTLALELGVPLSATFSCNCRSGRHCWECTGCRERQEAFDALGISL